MCVDKHVTCISVTLTCEDSCKQPGVLICSPCFHLMSQNHPTCQRNSLHLKLASPNEILICYYEHSRCLQRCLWASDLKALNALNLRTNGFQAGKKLDVSIKVTSLVLKMESDHLSPANDISLVQQRRPNGCGCIQYGDRVIPLDNNHGILPSQ